MSSMLQTYYEYGVYLARRTDKEIQLRDIYGEGVMMTETSAERLEAQARRLLEYAQEIRDEKARFGEDNFEDGTIIQFDKVFPRGTRVYKYAAIKTIHFEDKYGNNQEPVELWYTTGPMSPKGYTWEELTQWMGKDVKEIWVVTQLEQIVGGEE